MELFVLNDVDYTKYITVPSYKVQSEPVTKTWEDATYTNHTDILRYRVKGSFTMYFDNVTELDNFLDAIINATGYYKFYIDATFYDNRTHSQKTSKYSIKVDLENNKPLFGVKAHNGFNVTIEEQ